MPIDNSVSYLQNALLKHGNGTNFSDGNIQSLSGILNDDESLSGHVENIDEIESSVTINELRRAKRLQEW